MYGSIIRKLAMYGGAIALATALAAPPALADDDDKDKDSKITSTHVNLDEGRLVILGKNFPESACVILDGEELTVIGGDGNEVVAELPGDMLNGVYVVKVGKAKYKNGRTKCKDKDTFHVAIEGSGPVSSTGTFPSVP